MLTELTTIARALSSPKDPDDLSGFEPEAVEAAMRLMDWLDLYMPTEVRGLEHLPDRPSLLVGNHNAGITFLEPFFLGRAFLRHTGEPVAWLGHDAVVDMPGVGRLLVAGGAVRAGHEGADAAFRAGRTVAVYPGGGWEAFRPWTQRHTVDLKGRTGFVRLALRHGVPMVPVLHLGGHDSFVILRRGERLARITGLKRLLRAPACPVYLGLPTGVGVGPFFHLPLPTRCLVEILEPIEVGEPDPDPSQERLAELSAHVQQRLQQAMTTRAAEGRWGLRGRRWLSKLDL